MANGDKKREESKAVHLLAGGVAGTLGSVVTCPLDVVKTRFQSSLVINVYQPELRVAGVGSAAGCNAGTNQRNTRIGLYRFFKYIVQTEGASALFKGLGPTLIGVAPSRSIYFFAYSQCKVLYRDLFVPTSQYGNSAVHLCSAATAGFITTTATNPIWLIKTKLQLDNSKGAESTARCVRRVYEREGLRGFYRGLTASYYGIAETAIHFVIYEGLRERLVELRQSRAAGSDVPTGLTTKALEVAEYMGAASISKTVATCIAYPHEVARTRIREDGERYKKFWPTLRLVAAEEGTRGLYRGLLTQLIKHIPNSAIVMATYEVVVELCRNYRV